MILRFYNQLQAYSQLFIEKPPLHPLLDLQELLKILEDMKPPISDVNIYEDSKVRKDLAFQHIQSEVIEKEEQKTYHKASEFNLTSSLRNSFKTRLKSHSKLITRNKLQLGDS